jgi:2,3-bisphosphoglycerate-dependent phosphoglycerate mutase
MPDQVTRLLIIRHGETAWNTESRIQGHTDIALNDKGRWQAERVGAALADEALDAIYSSDLQRACLTAQAIADATQLPLTLDVSLRERHFGRFEGKTQAEVAQHWPDEAQRWRSRDPSYGPEGGEALQDFYQRCVEAVQRVAAQHLGQTIAIVAHGGVLDCFYRAATGVALDAPRTWHINNASVNRLLYSPEGLSLLAWGDTRHLDDAGPALDENSDGATGTAA